MDTLTVDELTLEVRRSARRQSLQLTVDRGGELIVSAPSGVDDSVLAAFVREKKFWLYTKLAEKEAMARPASGKEFVSGEGFAYLGKSYRLLLVDEQDVPLKLVGGRFCLRRDEVDSGREHFVRWYRERGRVWLARRVREWAPHVGATPASLDVRDIGYRWGSCTPAGDLALHWATLQLPRRVADYVVLHEMVHLVHPNHGPEFWTLVERCLPEYERHHAWLAKHGGGMTEL